MEPILSRTLPDNTVAREEFNSVHNAWKLGAIRQYLKGEEINLWAEKHDLAFLIISEPTREAGNTLDLTWENIDGVVAWIAHNGCITGDHPPIHEQVPIRLVSMSLGHPKIRVTRGNPPCYA